MLGWTLIYAGSVGAPIDHTPVVQFNGTLIAMLLCSISMVVQMAETAARARAVMDGPPPSFLMHGAWCMGGVLQ